MIIAGTVTRKFAPVVRRLYDQMPEPRWVIAMGTCAISGGVYNTYAVVQGSETFVPVDVHVPGCPPRPEMLIDAMFKLREKVRHTPIGIHAVEVAREDEQRQLTAPAAHELKGLLR